MITMSQPGDVARYLKGFIQFKSRNINKERGFLQ